MKTKEFFTLYPVFTHDEFAEAVIEKEKKTHGLRATEALLAYHLKASHLTRIRRGLYAVSEKYNALSAALITPYLIGMKLTPDGVMGYHTALAFQGKAHSFSNQFQLLTYQPSHRIYYKDYEFQLIQFPKSLREKAQCLLGVKQSIAQPSMTMRVTHLERTLVDVLDKPALGGGWEEIWRSLESIDYFDIEQIIHYALLLGRANTIGLVGFYLEQHQTQLHVKEQDLKQLERHRPKQPVYVERFSRQPAKLHSRWNLIIPLKITQRIWEEQ